MKKILIILMLCLTFCGCNNKEKTLEELMKENEYIIVDVRSEAEYNQAHLVDAINIPYDELEVNNNLDKDKLILVYCMSGTRSKIAYNTLTELGYDVYDLGAYADITLPKE